ncbi:MAG: spermidine synthase [Legionella sp.]
MLWISIEKNCIHQSSSGFKVYQDRHYRWLTLNSHAMQTRINFKKPEQPALIYIKPIIEIFKVDPGDCCLLGLGGGGIAHALQPFIDDFQFISVESNAEVISLAKTYFMIDQIKISQIILNDACIFIERCQRQFNYLIIDLFDAYSFPQHCNNQRFFDDCRNLLLPNGILVINLVSSPILKTTVYYLRQAFSNRTISIPVPGTKNFLILAMKNQSITNLLNLVQNVFNFKKIAWDNEWGCFAIMK